MARDVGTDGTTILLVFGLGLLAGAAAMAFLRPFSAEDLSEKLNDRVRNGVDKVQGLVAEGRDRVGAAVAEGRNAYHDAKAQAQS